MLLYALKLLWQLHSVKS